MPRERFATMDGVRGVAALCVMLFHYTNRTSHLFPMGYTEVDLFFCLSGFVVAHAYEERLDGGWTALQFARARLIRLYPLYAVGLGLGLLQYSVAAMMAGTPNTTLATARAILSGVLLLPTLTPFQTGAPGPTTLNLVFPFNNPAWSLSLELAANVFFFLYRPRGWALFATVLVLTFAAAGYAVEANGFGGTGQATFFEGFPRVLFGFFAGFCLCRLWRAGRLDGLPRTAVAPVFLAVAMTFAPHTVPSLLLVTMVVAPWIIALSLNDPASPRLRSVFSWLGEASYPIYLLHYPMLNLAALAWNRAFGLPLDEPLPTAPALAVAAFVFALSLALSRFFDAPVRRWLSARHPAFANRRAPEAA